MVTEQNLTDCIYEDLIDSVYEDLEVRVVEREILINPPDCKTRFGLYAEVKHTLDGIRFHVPLTKKQAEILNNLESPEARVYTAIQIDVNNLVQEFPKITRSLSGAEKRIEGNPDFYKRLYFELRDTLPKAVFAFFSYDPVTFFALLNLVNKPSRSIDAAIRDGVKGIATVREVANRINRLFPYTLPTRSMLLESKR